LPDIQADDIGIFGIDGVRFHQVRVESAQVLHLWPKLPSRAVADPIVAQEPTLASGAPTERVPGARRGRKPEHDWAAIKKKCFELLDERGDYDAEPRKRWNKQADLEDELLQFMSDEFGREASTSAIRADDKLRVWVAEWRQLKVRKGH
jgi:hypothetical protein